MYFQFKDVSSGDESTLDGMCKRLRWLVKAVRNCMDSVWWRVDYYTRKGIFFKINANFYPIGYNYMEHTRLSQYVKAMRKQYNLTQIELSEKSGVIRNWQMGKRISIKPAPRKYSVLQWYRNSHTLARTWPTISPTQKSSFLAIIPKRRYICR